MSFAPYETVYGHFASWREDATEQVHDLLRRAVRRSRGRAEEPTSKSYAETLQTSSHTMIHRLIIGIMSRALTGRAAGTWQDPTLTST
jgi:hypothetical protein